GPSTGHVRAGAAVHVGLAQGRGAPPGPPAPARLPGRLAAHPRPPDRAQRRGRLLLLADDGRGLPGLRGAPAAARDLPVVPPPAPASPPTRASACTTPATPSRRSSTSARSRPGASSSRARTTRSSTAT